MSCTIYSHCHTCGRKTGSQWLLWTVLNKKLNTPAVYPIHLTSSRRVLLENLAVTNTKVHYLIHQSLSTVNVPLLKNLNITCANGASLEGTNDCNVVK